MANAADAELPRPGAGRASRASTALLAPLRDPYAAAGILIYAVVRADRALRRRDRARTTRWKSCSAPTASCSRPRRRARTICSAPPISAATSSPSSIIGTRAALYVGLTAAVVVALIGTVVGLVSGYFGGWIDSVLMRLADVALGIPFLPFVILMAASSGRAPAT